MDDAKIHKIEKFIRNETTLFKGLSEQALVTMIHKLETRTIQKGEKIVTQGDIGDSLFIVVYGSFEVLTQKNGGEPKKLGEVGRGEVIGEGALITKEPRNATVVAVEESGVFSLSHTSFQEILESNPGEFKSFVELVGKRSRSVHPGLFRPDARNLREFLHTTELLSSVNEKTLAKIAPKVKWVFIPGGEKLMTQGEPGNSMYMVVNGRLRFFVENENGTRVAEGEFTRGDIIGEMSLLTGEKRSATVYSVRACELVRLSGATFGDLIKHDPEAMFAITKTIAKRLQDKQAGLSIKKRKSASIVTLFPMQSQPIDPQVRNNLVEALKKTGKNVKLASKSEFKEYLKTQKPARNNHSGNDADQEYDLGQATSWLYKVEQEHDLVLLEAELEDPVWSDIVLHHTDRIILVARGLGGRELSPGEIRYLGALDERFSPGRYLVLLYKDGEEPENTDEWLSERSVRKFIHVKMDDPAGYERIARHLAGKSVGLALGGGGAKGAAHIGMIRAFEEEGIPIDMIGGTSLGCIVASIYSQGIGWQKTVDISLKLMSGDAAMSDYGWPTMSLIQGKKLTKVLQNTFKNRKIEDLWIPFFGVATDLTKTQKKIINTGELWKAVRASMSLPGIFPPFYNEGSVLVDGALLDNVPGSVLKKLGMGYSMAVSLNSSEEHDTDIICEELFKDRGYGVSPARFGIWKKLRKKDGALDGLTLGGILMRATMVNSEAMAQKTREEVDLYLELPVDEFGMFAFDEAEKIIDAGYRYAKENADEWKKKLGLA